MPTNPYDSLIANPGDAAAGGPSNNPYDDLIVDEQARQQTQMRASVSLAADSNPQTIAAQRQLAKYVGFKPAVGEALPDQVKQMATVKRVSDDTVGQPVLQKAYSDADFARIGHDDSSALKSVGEAIGKTAAYVMGATPDGGLPQRAYTGLLLNGEIGSAGFFRLVSEALAAPLNLAGLDKVTSIGGNPLQRLAEGFAMAGQSAQAEKDRLVKADNSVLGGGIDSGIESAFQNAKYMPLALAGPPGIAAALAGMVAETGGTTYQADREAGVMPGRAGLHAATDMVAEYVGERYFGAAGFLKKLSAGSSAGKLAAYELTHEIPGEVGTTLWQNFNEWALVNQDKTVAQFLEEQPAAVAQTIVATLVGGGGQIALGKGITKVAENVFGRQAQIEEAQAHVERLQDLFKRATETKTWERDPDTFGALVQQMAEGTPNAPTSVFVDARKLVETLQANPEAEGVFNQMPQPVKDQLQEALATNGTVEIPLGDLVAKGAGTALESALLPHVRRTENSLSATEAKEASARSALDLQQEAERVIAESEQGEAIRTSAEAVGKQVLEQLNAIGRNTADVNQSYATLIQSFYTATSARLGMTPEEMFAKYPLSIKGETVGEGYNAGKLGEITVEGYHYSKADRSVVSTSMYGTGLQGTGLQGSNREAFQNASDKRLGKRAYSYADTGTGINPEAGVGGRGHKATLSNIYDADTDPQRLKGGSQQDFESKVLDAGFSGYLDRMSGTQSGQVILLGDQNVPVQSLGALGKTQGQRVPEKGTRESKGRDVVVDALNADTALPSGSPTLARWQELLAKNPEVLQALTDAGVFSGDQTQTAYKSELIKAYQDATPAEVYAQKAETSNVKLPKKQTATTAVDIRKGGRLTGDQAMDIHQVAAYFDKIAGGPSDFNDPKAQAKALKAITAELEYQLSQEKSGLDWYEEDIKTAFELTQQVIPELADPRQRMLFSVVAGLQSPGTNARDNWAIAAEAFQHYKATGTIPGRNPKTGGLWQGGPVSANKEKALDFLNNMVQDLGESATIDWLMGQHTVKELNSARKQWGNMGPGVTGKATDTAMGVVAFGPKVGPFVMNINGIHEITVDVWATRSFNRYFGTMLGPDGKITDAPTEPQRRVAKELFNAAAEKVGIKAYQVQSVLWFFEQQLFNHLGTGTPSYGFSDGARKFAGANGVDTGAFAGLPVPGRDAQAAAGEVDGRYEQAGNGSGRPAGGNLAPLEGAPSVPGFSGPDSRIVAVAEQYARDNGIELKRQSDYVRVDPERATRIAAAYEAMQHNPQDPAVKEAYDNLIKQTLAQYQALEKAGYKFWFIDTRIPANADYASSPWNAMRDMRANQEMGVFPTSDGFGSSDADVSSNPLLADTGIQWPVGGPDGPLQPVLANDLFRAVHDAFGHGMEGAGFRADGEENAWQAHSRLFTGSALGAITSETRDQNSWLNYGPNGESNRTAKVEDTIFADQKTGLMPEWTWTEGRAGDMAPETLQQGPRGTFNPKTLTISLLQDANLSTFLHESGHFFLEVMADLASQADAPEQIKSDFAKTLKWFGIKDAEDGTKALDVWHAMSLDEKRPYHERWAESFEQYLIEGKAPSLELRGAFQRFRGWLTTLYKSIKDFANGRNLQISGEIRAVMDRLVATEEQIAEAEQQAKYEAIYKSAEEGGMSPEEWAVYQEEHKAGTDTAIDEMQKRSMADMRWAAEARSKALRKAQKAVEELRKAMHAQVTEEVMATPLQLARAYIKELRQSTPEQKAALKAWNEQRATTLAAALDEEKAALLAANPETKGLQKGQLLAKNKKAMENAAEAKAIAWEQQNPRPTPVLPAVEMDSVAERFGFSSGDELAKAMKEQPSAKDTIEGITEQRLLEEHGELVTQKGIQRAANEAVHNEARARFVATELATLQHAMNQKAKAPGAKVSTNVLVKAAKEFAKAIVGRRKIMELNAGRYTAAETRAAAAVQKAMAAGDQAGAVSAQRDRLLNLYAAKETVSAREEIKRAVEYLRKFEKDSVRTKLPPEYLDQIDALLEKFDLKQATTQKEIARRKSLATWIASQQELGIEPNIPQELIDKAGLTSYKEMTVDEFRGLADTIKQIEHLGRLKSKLLTAKDQREYQAIRDAIAKSINDNAGNRKADTRTPTTNLGRWFQAVKNFGAAHIKAATWARVMDGGKDGGPVWEFFVRPANERGDMETTMRAEAAQKLHAIIDPWLQGKPAGGKGVYFDSIKRSLNRESILAIALNTGNESNLQRLLGGEGWTLAQLKPVLNTLTPGDWQVVQNIWNHFESYRPLIGAKEMRVFGKEPEWIAHGSSVTAAYSAAGATGLSGGYYPIKYDPAASVRAEEHADAEGAKRLLKGAYGAATTQRSFTKGRVDEVNGRPLLYTLSGLYSGVNDVIHDLAWHEWLIDVNRLLKSQTIDTAIREHYGPEAVRQLKSWRDAVAEGDSASQEAIDSALSRLRQGVSVAGLGFNVMSALMQPLGMTQSVVRVGAKWIGKGTMQYIGNPVAATQDVQERSEFMAGRARTRFRELNEIRNNVQGETKARQAMTQTAYFLMMQCQQMVDVPTWLGAYEKATSEGNDDERSIALADQAVIDAQGGGMTKDLSAIERGGPAQKLFTVFYSFMNTALNLGVQKGMNSEPTTAGRAKLAADMLMLYTVPAVLGALLKDALTPGDSGDGDDWRKLLKKLLGEQLTFLLGLMVVAREFGEAGKGLLGLSDHPRDYAGPAGVRMVADAGAAAKQIQQGEFDDAMRKAVINLAGDLMGLPSAQINRTITGFNALKEGKTMNPAALALGYQEPR